MIPFTIRSDNLIKITLSCFILCSLLCVTCVMPSAAEDIPEKVRSIGTSLMLCRNSCFDHGLLLVGEVSASTPAFKDCRTKYLDAKNNIETVIARVRTDTQAGVEMKVSDYSGLLTRAYEANNRFKSASDKARKLMPTKGIPLDWVSTVVEAISHLSWPQPKPNRDALLKETKDYELPATLDDFRALAGK